MKHDELRRRVRKVLTGCEGCSPEDPCTNCITAGAALDQALDDVMDLVDQRIDTILTDLNGAYEGLWTAWEVSHYLGLADANSARAVLSKHGIRSIRTMPNPINNRPLALYSISEVQAKLVPRKAARR